MKKKKTELSVRSKIHRTARGNHDSGAARAPATIGGGPRRQARTAFAPWRRCIRRRRIAWRSARSRDTSSTRTRATSEPPSAWASPPSRRRGWIARRVARWTLRRATASDRACWALRTRGGSRPSSCARRRAPTASASRTSAPFADPSGDTPSWSERSTAIPKTTTTTKTKTRWRRTPTRTRTPARHSRTSWTTPSRPSAASTPSPRSSTRWRRDRDTKKRCEARATTTTTIRPRTRAASTIRFRSGRAPRRNPPRSGVS